MASGDQSFPPQKQDKQPGKEHVMNPLPRYVSSDYKPSNKLQVLPGPPNLSLLTYKLKVVLRMLYFFFAGEGGTSDW